MAGRSGADAVRDVRVRHNRLWHTVDRDADPEEWARREVLLAWADSTRTASADRTEWQIEAFARLASGFAGHDIVCAYLRRPWESIGAVVCFDVAPFEGEPPDPAGWIADRIAELRESDEVTGLATEAGTVPSAVGPVSRMWARVVCEGSPSEHLLYCVAVPPRGLVISATAYCIGSGRSEEWQVAVDGLVRGLSVEGGDRHGPPPPPEEPFSILPVEHDKSRDVRRTARHARIDYIPRTGPEGRGIVRWTDQRGRVSELPLGERSTALRKVVLVDAPGAYTALHRRMLFVDWQGRCLASSAPMVIFAFIFVWPTGRLERLEDLGVQVVESEMRGELAVNRAHPGALRAYFRHFPPAKIALLLLIVVLIVALMLP